MIHLHVDTVGVRPDLNIFFAVPLPICYVSEEVRLLLSSFGRQKLSFVLDAFAYAGLLRGYHHIRLNVPILGKSII